MSNALTARQTQILKSLVDEYIETAEPVGSEALEKKYNLGVSPATIRNEMVALTKMGHFRQPHKSAGRIPSPKAMKFYIDQLMEERQMSLAEEVKVKEEVLGSHDGTEELLEEATHSLAQATKALAVAGWNKEEKVWHSGYANVFANPEFTDLETTSSLFSFLEEVQRMHDLFFRQMTGIAPVEVIFGEELGWPGFRPVCFVGTRFVVRGNQGALGIIGPASLPYSRVIPVLRYYRDLIEELGA